MMGGTVLAPGVNMAEACLTQAFFTAGSFFPSSSCQMLTNGPFRSHSTPSLTPDDGPADHENALTAKLTFPDCLTTP